MKKGWFEDRDGVWSIFKDPDSSKTYTIDVNRWAGLTISGTATWAVKDGELSILSSSNTTTVLTIKVTKTGEATVTFIDGDGDTQVETFRWKERDR